MDPVPLFAHTVPEASAALAAAAGAAGASTEVIAHPLTGPDGEVLATTVVRLGPMGAPNVLFAISGVHGIEGYFGSAMMAEALTRREELLALTPDTAVVMVHLVNPWGTAWSSRENEDNVELLRGNYYRHHPKPPNAVFADFYDTMRFGATATLDEFLANRVHFQELVDRHGLEPLMTAIVDGQDSHPDAIVYTGTGPTWSKRLLDDVVRRHLPGAQQVVVLDLHTAVGPPGETVVFHGMPDDDVRAQLVVRCFGELWPNHEGLEFYDWFAELVPGVRTISLTCEAGTEQLGPLDHYIFPLDVWIKCYGDRNDPAAAPHLARYRRFFYPEHEEWMASVLSHGRRRWRQALHLLDEWSKEDPR
jgi:polar amino acid transport system ATP-binding protein